MVSGKYTGWLKIKYPTREYAISPQPVVYFKYSWSCLILTLLWIQRFTMYPLHLNYTTTLPCKTITMKITIFIIVLVLKSNENMEIWHFRLSQLANCSKPCKNSLHEDVFKVSAPSFNTSSKSCEKAQYGLVDGVLWQIIPYCLQDLICYKFLKILTTS